MNLFKVNYSLNVISSFILFLSLSNSCLASESKNPEVEAIGEVLKNFKITNHKQDENGTNNLEEQINQLFLLLREETDTKTRSAIVQSLDNLLNMQIVKYVFADEDTHSIFYRISLEVGNSFKKLSDSHVSSINLLEPHSVQRHLTNLLFALKVVHDQSRSFLDWTTRRQYFHDLLPAPIRSKWKLVKKFNEFDTVYAVTHALGCQCFHLKLPGSEHQIVKLVEEHINNILDDEDWLAQHPLRLTAEDAKNNAKKLYENFVKIDHDKATSIMMLSLIKSSYMRYYFDFGPEIFKKSWEFTDETLPQYFNSQYFNSQQNYLYLKDFYQIGTSSYLKVRKFCGCKSDSNAEKQKWFHRVGVIFAVFDDFFEYLPTESPRI
ncbi:MAG: hypothetical protein AB8G05_20850 [Oligoflexales bacterium]